MPPGAQHVAAEAVSVACVEMVQPQGKQVIPSERQQRFCLVKQELYTCPVSRIGARMDNRYGARGALVLERMEKREGEWLTG